MIDKIRATVSKYNMLPKGATVIAAVSGGSDSMVLLNALNLLKNEYEINLIAAHVNHGLREKTADRDESFVYEKCREAGIELHVLKADVTALAKQNGESLEECGRRVRYDFFNSLANGAIIATAHNLSDRAETFIFNFTRGSALRGLCSTPPVRENIIRPLIDCSKEEIIAFCEKNSIEFVTDETNSDVKYSRNRIRHNVISELKKINPSFESCAQRCIEAVNEDEKFLFAMAAELAEKAKTDEGYNASVLSQAANPVKKRAIVYIIEKCTRITPEQKFIGKICDLLNNGGKTQINGGVTVRVRKGILDFPADSEDFEQVELADKPVFFGGAKIEAKIVNINKINNLQNFLKQGLEYYLDYDKILGKIFVRSRESGDKITLKSRNCTKTLKKLFNELAIPEEKRNSIAVFADDNGVFLVEGAGFDKRVSVTNQTKNALIIKIQR